MTDYLFEEGIIDMGLTTGEKKKKKRKKSARRDHLLLFTSLNMFSWRLLY